MQLLLIVLNKNNSYNGLATGIYYYALYADGVRMDVKKMVMMK
jgi:hypothetical protein